MNELALQVLSGKYVEGDTIFVDADNKGFVFSEEGYKGDGTIPMGNGAAGKTKQREKQVDKLNKTTKEVNDLVQDIKEDDDDSNDDDSTPDTKAQRKK